ncbi:unnamed protein product [Moneuplotes crassus]|uniref:Uncharacterized protein n=1 Tax=Euplotes crassus TaxID=5936 RepID=A0AAD1X1F7_EUPCR|nr:unnamed protein product [Moneuplotes crassus]
MVHVVSSIILWINAFNFKTSTFIYSCFILEGFSASERWVFRVVQTVIGYLVHKICLSFNFTKPAIM